MRLIIRSTLLVGVVACTGKTPDAAASKSPAKEAAPTTASSVLSGDSLRGIIGVRGRDSVPDLVLQTGADTLLLRSADLETLRRVVGTEVVVRGARLGANFDVATFVVRAVNGEPATDGVLDVDKGLFFVRTESGIRANITTIPSPLRGEIGSRVYLVGPLDRLPTAFGIIAEAR